MRFSHKLMASAAMLALLAACGTNTPMPTAISVPVVSPSITVQPGVTPSATIQPGMSLPATPQPSATHTKTAIASSTTPPKTPTSPPLPSAGAVAPITPSIQVEDEVKIPVSDGVDLAGTFYAPEQATAPWPGVLLLHMAYGDRHDWGDFAQQLSTDGYAVLAIDLRGHGKSGGNRDWSKGPQDTARAWEYLTNQPGVDPQRTAIIGASFGANLALVQGTAEEAVRTVVLLSPGLNYFGIPTAGAMQDFDERPVLIAASKEDSYAAESARQLKQLATGPAELQMFDGAGHGTHMFIAQPELAQEVLDWLAKYLQNS
jgi:dienelactone hydrolase